MCGIFGYIGKKNAAKISLEGLKKLEYRGYDSAGLAGIHEGKLYFWKEVGKVADLENLFLQNPQELTLAIAHTRWATHGGITQANAHPHIDGKNTLALVHNGIIENYIALRKTLMDEGVSFLSQTDTEVVAHLIAKHYQGDLLAAVKATVAQLQGAYAMALIHKDHPDTIVAIAQECPLVIGIGEEEAFLSSDPHAFAFYTRQVIYLSDGEIGLITADQVHIFHTKKGPIIKPSVTLANELEESSKGEFDHFTLKEIYEQPLTLRRAMANRLSPSYGTALFDELRIDHDLFARAERVLLLGCGTSYHAGLISAYMIEELARIPAQVEIASEFRYKHPIITPNTLVVAISQSGETADTLASMRQLRPHHVPVLGICNVQGSTIARESDNTLLLRAGPEIGVCSTKAFTSQLTVLALVTLMLARMRHMTQTEGQNFLRALTQLPEQIKEIIANVDLIQGIAIKYAKYQNFFFLGRNYMYPTSLEGALKLKEISYIEATGYPAGEMKHGPIALIGPDCPSVALTANLATFDKMASNIEEVKARKGPVLIIGNSNSKQLEYLADDLIIIPPTIDPLAPILTTIVTQLLAYYIAKERGTEIDQPRNLAKSVTVE